MLLMIDNEAHYHSRHEFLSSFQGYQAAQFEKKQDMKGLVLVCE